MTTRFLTSGPRWRPRGEYGQVAEPCSGDVLRLPAMVGVARLSPRTASHSAPTRSTCLALALVLGCGSADGGSGSALESQPSEVPTSTGATDLATAPAPPAGRYAGTYSVPVATELEPYAAFQLESVRLERSSVEVRLSYDLPAALLGESRRLSFRGTFGAEGLLVLEGDDGVARCQVLALGLRCDEELEGVELDADALERQLRALPEAEARARRAVAGQFASDPIGVLGVEFGR